MADIKVSKSPFTIDAVANYVIGGSDAGDSQIVVAHITSNTATGSMLVKGRARGSAKAFAAISYTSRHLNAVAGTGLPVSTAMTNTSVIEIDSSGLDVSLDATALSAGTFTVDYSCLSA